MDRLDQKLILVTRRTRLDELVTRFNTIDQARFYVEHLGADFSDYEREHATYQQAVHEAEAQLLRLGRVQRLDRAFLPNFLFPPEAPVVVVGQDGLVANTIKYLDGQTVVGVNPDPTRIDGVLLPFAVRDLRRIVPEVLARRRPCRDITMGCARLADGQTLYAVNDFFVGARSHVSARYDIQWSGQQERHSSSGVIVSTGLGSSGWLRSVLRGAAGLAGAEDPEVRELREHGFAWDADHLQFSVREPFPSRYTQTELVCGRIDAQAPLSIISGMAENGVIFSDGIESDFLAFNAGVRAEFLPAERKGRLAG